MERLDASYAAKATEKRLSLKGGVRCARCWLDKTTRCICSRLPLIEYRPGTEFIIYMDYREYLNPGDDAKLLLCTAFDPSMCHLILYPQDDDKLAEIIDKVDRYTTNICVLFPNDRSISFDEYRECCHEMRPTASRSVIIVVDGVWRRARKMASHLFELYPTIPHVQLTPEQLSVYARQQSQEDRICTVEALALFLKCLGERDEVISSLIDAIKLNNGALKRKPNSAKL